MRRALVICLLLAACGPKGPVDHPVDPTKPVDRVVMEPIVIKAWEEGGVIKSEAYDAALLFDEAYVRSQWEDTDFMFQVIRHGLRCVATGDVHILHENHWTNATDENWQRNREHFFAKWPDFEEIRASLYGASRDASRTVASYADS